MIVSQGSGRGENPFRPLGRLRVAIPAVLPVPSHGFPGRPQCPSCWGEHGRGGCHRREQGTAALPPQPSVSEASLHPADRHPQNTGVRSPTPHSLRARRHRNSNAARERPLRSSLLVGRNGEFACLYGSIVSHSATSICEQRNPFQSPCDPLLTVPVLRSYLPNGLQSVGNSMPSASNGPLPRQLGARPSPSRDVKGRSRPSNDPHPRVPKGCATGTPVPQHHR